MSFTLWNSTNQSVKDVIFWIYAPVKETSTQQYVNINASHSYEIETDELGNQILEFTFMELPPYAAKIIDIEAHLMLSNRLNKKPIQQFKRYIRPEKYCESDHSLIIDLAKKLIDENPLKTSNRIFKWVSGNVTYSGYTKNTRGALYSIRERKGDCTEFSYLFTALCRANGINARTVGGYICHDNSVIKPGGYHNWAEFYDNDRWKMVDPQRKVFVKNQLQYIVMRILGESTIDSGNEDGLFGCIGEGVEVKMNG